MKFKVGDKIVPRYRPRTKNPARIIGAFHINNQYFVDFHNKTLWQRVEYIDYVYELYEDKTKGHHLTKIFKN